MKIFDVFYQILRYLHLNETNNFISHNIQTNFIDNQVFTSLGKKHIF